MRVCMGSMGSWNKQARCSVEAVAGDDVVMVIKLVCRGTGRDNVTSEAVSGPKKHTAMLCSLLLVAKISYQPLSHHKQCRRDTG